MTERRRGPAPKPIDNWNACCLAAGFHRWDCTRVDAKLRSRGPFGPIDADGVQHPPIVVLVTRDARTRRRSPGNL